MAADWTIQAVVFDLDDTLYPERDYVRSGYRAIARHLRRKLSTRRPFERWLWARFCSGRSAGAFDAMNAYYHLGLDKQGILELVDVFRRHTPDIRPFDDVPPLLERLGRCCALGVLSDGYLPAQQIKLEAIGLAGHFRAIVFTEELGREAWKPSRRGFDHIRELLGVPGAACAYVGDNPAKDFLAPNELGWLTVQYVRPGQVHAGRKSPDGGAAQVVVRDSGGLLAALGVAATAGA